MRIENKYTNTNMPNKDLAKLLQSLLEDGKMDLSEVLDMCDMVNKKKIIREKYQSKIKHRKDDDRYYIYINRKQVVAKSEDALYQKLYDLEYGAQTYSMSDIFPLWLKWKRDNTAVTGRTLLRQEDYKDGVMKIRSQHLLDVDMNDDLTFSENRFINSDHVKGNTEHGFRSIPLNDTARACVEKAISLNPGGEFIFMFDDKQLSVSTFNARLRRYCKEIGIPYRSSHKIRFCVASILYQNGMPLTELKRLLGHSTTAMTLHYLRNVSADSHTLDIMQSALG